MCFCHFFLAFIYFSFSTSIKTVFHPIFVFYFSFTSINKTYFVIVLILVNDNITDEQFLLLWKP